MKPGLPSFWGKNASQGARRGFTRGQKGPAGGQGPDPLPHPGGTAHAGATGTTGTAGTAHLAAVEVAEAVCERGDDVAAEGVVEHFAVVVRRIGDAQLLRLAEDVVAFHGQRELLLEEVLLDLGVQHILGIHALVGITLVPVVVTLALEGDARAVPGPGGSEAQLVVESENVVRRRNGVGAPVHAGASASREFQGVGAVDEAQPLGDAQRAGAVLGEVGCEVSVVRHVAEQFLHESVVVVPRSIGTHVDTRADVRRRLGIIGPGEVGNRELGAAERDICEPEQACAEGVGTVERHGIGGTVGIPDCADHRVRSVRTVEADIERRERLLVIVAHVAVQVVREIRLERRITEVHVQRIGIVGHRHQLAGGGLGDVAAVEEAGVGVLAELPPHHGARRELPGGIGCIHRRVFLR